MKHLKFGGKLDILRRAHGFTIGSLALKCGIPESTMERICLGQNSPSARNLVAILKSLHINLDVVEPEDFEEDGML